MECPPIKHPSFETCSELKLLGLLPPTNKESWFYHIQASGKKAYCIQPKFIDFYIFCPTYDQISAIILRNNYKLSQSASTSTNVFAFRIESLSNPIKYSPFFSSENEVESIALALVWLLKNNLHETK